MSNVFSFTGRLGRDAEVRSTPSGQTVLSVAVANDVGYGENKKTLWIRVSVWGKRAEGPLGELLKKGREVFVSGVLTEQEFTGNDGIPKKTLEVNASIIDLVGGRQESGQQQQSAPQQRPQQSRAPAPATNQRQPAPPVNDNFDDFDDDIPF